MKEEFENLYEKQGEAPWTFEHPTEEIVILFEKGEIKGKILEIGCGEGHNAIYLASKGLDVTAIDFSENALKHARQHAKKARVECNFLTKDYHNLESINNKFDFIFDWRFFHELINEKDRNDYLDDIKRLLDENGKYLSVSFSGDSKLFGTGLLRKAPTGITLFFPTLHEAEKIFGKNFEIIDAKHIKVPEKPDITVTANYLLMKQKYS